jgi:hypothetical protein
LVEALYYEYKPDGRDKTTQIQSVPHYVCATEPNRLMLFGETIAAYCENLTNRTIHCEGRMQRCSMSAGGTFCNHCVLRVK